VEHMRCKKDGNTCACIPWTTRVKRKKEAKMRRREKKEKRDDVCGIHLIQVFCLSFWGTVAQKATTPGNEARGGSGMSDHNFLFSPLLVKQKETPAVVGTCTFTSPARVLVQLCRMVR